MIRTTSILWIAVLGGAVVAVAIAARSAARAQREARLHLAAFGGLRTQVTELDRLQALTRQWPQRPTDTSLTQEIGAALSVAGLPAGSLANLSPDSGAAVPGTSELVQLRAGMTLNNVTLPQVGRFLSEWRRRQPIDGPVWTVTAIDLTPESGGAQPAGGDMPLRAVLTLESIVTDGEER